MFDFLMQMPPHQGSTQTASIPQKALYSEQCKRSKYYIVYDRMLKNVALQISLKKDCKTLILSCKRLEQSFMSGLHLKYTHKVSQLLGKLLKLTIILF